jgi:hypothetical protein
MKLTSQSLGKSGQIKNGLPLLQLSICVMRYALSYLCVSRGGSVSTYEENYNGVCHSKNILSVMMIMMIMMMTMTLFNKSANDCYLV